MDVLFFMQTLLYFNLLQIRQSHNVKIGLLADR